MTTFDDRERAFENRYAHDQDLLFRARARRDREVGLWAARMLGLDGAEADAYAAGLLAASVEGGTEAVLAKLAENLGRHGLGVAEIRRRLDEAMAEAVERAKRG